MSKEANDSSDTENDPLKEYLDGMDWAAFEEKLPDLCCHHLKNFRGRPNALHRLTEMFPICARQTILAGKLLADGEAYDLQNAMELAAERIKEARRGRS